MRATLQCRLNSRQNTCSLGELVEPVVWNYVEDLDTQYFPDFWSGFAQNFPYIWAASAFKGDCVKQRLNASTKRAQAPMVPIATGRMCRTTLPITRAG